jgi:hypothetical protein
MALADLAKMKELADRIREDVGDLHQVYRGNYVPMGGDFVPTAAQQAVADVIDVLEAAADTLDEALVRAEREGTFDPRAGGSP